MGWNTQSVAMERRPDEDGVRSLTLSFPKPVSTNNLYLNIPGRGRVPTSEYKAWRIEASGKVRKQRPISFRGAVTLSIVIENGDRGDLDNRIKCVLDLLVELNVIEDDNPRIVKEIRIRQGAVTGALVTITAFNDEGPLFQKGARG